MNNSPDPVSASDIPPSRPRLYRFFRIAFIVIAICAVVFLVVKIIFSSFLGEFSDFDIQNHPEKYPAFDFANVEMRPEWYKNTTGMISGTFVGFISLPPGSDSPYTYLQIAQDGLVDNKNAIWIVYGVLSDDDKQKLTEGMDVVAYGHCTGLVTVQRLAFDEERPGLLFENIKFGTWIRP